MSQPIKLTAGQLRMLADTLDVLTTISLDKGADIEADGDLRLSFAGNTLRLGYENDQWIIDEKAGS